MHMQTKNEIVLILIIHLSIVKCEYFGHDTKSLNIIREQSLNLDCIHVNIFNMDDFVFSLVLKMNIPLIISNGLNGSERKKQTPVCPNLIVQLDSSENLVAMFDSFVAHSGIIFILFGQKINWHNIAKHSEYYWKKHRLYSVFYITDESAKFYHPFVMWNDKHGAMVDTKNYNIKDLFKNLYGYPVRVCLFDSTFSELKTEQDTLSITKVEGVDAEVAYLLEKILNFTIQLQWLYDGYFGARLENGSFSGALDRIIRAETDITMTGFFIKDYLTHDIHFSVSVYMDKLCCYVIKSKRIPESVLPLYAVDKNVWFVYLSVGLCSSFVWILIRHANFCIRKFEFETTYFSSTVYLHYLNIFADTWALWVRMIIIRFPPFNAERIFVVSLSLVSVIIGALFESSLATVYINPRYYKNINSLEELERTNLKIFIKHAAMRDDLFKGQNSRLYDNLNERIVLVEEPENRMISTMSKRGGFVAVSREWSLLIADIYYLITKKIHIISECPKTYHIAYLYTKNSPYEETFNAALLKFLAAGLIDQWIEVSRHQAQCQIHNLEHFIAESSYEWNSFEINDLQLAFYVLISGNICAVFLFFTEFVVFKN